MKKVLCQKFDLAIIGGGINGAAIARDAALRGMKVILFEKNDFGSGASTKTSKLAHGGLRYLEQLNLFLVRESLEERALLFRHAPHLIKPLHFILPLYKNDPLYGWMVNLGLRLYDFFGRQDAMPKHTILSRQQIAEILPGIKPQGLLKGFCYYDAQMNDTRLLIENLLSAEEAGACIYNYAPVIELSIDNGRIDGLYVQFSATKEPQKIHADQVVNATGAWCNEIAQMNKKVLLPLVAPTKGCHLILPRWIEKPLLLRAPQDGRVFFILPWGDESYESLTLVGTTDTFFEGKADDAAVESADVDYLLTAVNFYFPHLLLTKNSVIASYAGLRPLAAFKSQASPSNRSREHHIHVSPEGLISIYGGKYTAFRKIAEQVVDQLVAKNRDRKFSTCSTRSQVFPAASISLILPQLIEAGMLPHQVKHLISNYGGRSLEILKWMKSHSDLAVPLCTDHAHLKAELIYTMQKEHVKTLDDWFFRRTSIGYTSCKGIKCYRASSDIFEFGLKCGFA